MQSDLSSADTYDINDVSLTQALLDSSQFEAWLYHYENRPLHISEN